MYFSVRTSDAAKIRENGVRARSGPITIRHIAGEGYFYSPAVSKRYGTAPLRNRVKRIIREIMRSCDGTCPEGHYMIYYNASCDGLGRRDIEPLIRTLLGNLNSGKTT